MKPLICDCPNPHLPQLAEARASGSAVYVTLCETLLARRDEFELIYHLRILRPSETVEWLKTHGVE